MIVPFSLVKSNEMNLGADCAALQILPLNWPGHKKSECQKQPSTAVPEKVR